MLRVYSAAVLLKDPSYTAPELCARRALNAIEMSPDWRRLWSIIYGT